MTTVSKLGIHFQGNPELGTEATELIRASKIKIVKGIDVDGWPTPAGEMFPDARVFARFWIGGDSLEEQYVLRGADGADDYADLMAPRWAKVIAAGAVDILGPNEMHPASDTITAHVTFWQRWAERVVAAGGAPWFGSFGVGWPDIGQIASYADVARYCMAHGGGMEVHEYSAPNVLDGEGWYTLRYRRTIAELGFEVPVLIGECGIDWGVVPGQKNTGWKSHTSYVYPEQYGIAQGLMTEDRYWAQMSAYDDELLKDAYVIAATPFVTCPESSWKTFDFGGSLIKRVVAKHATAADEPVDIEAAIGAAIQAHIIPRNPDAALNKAAMLRNSGATEACDEVRDVAGYVAQAFWFPGDADTQHIAYCADGDWSNVKWIERAN